MKYIVKVICRDRGQNRECYFDERTNAIEQMNIFNKIAPMMDVPFWFDRVALLNMETQTVERILVYQNGKLREDLCDGDTVRLHPAYCDDESERDYLFRISNIHEDIGSCLIKCLNSKMAIAPCQQVGIEMVCKA